MKNNFLRNVLIVVMLVFSVAILVSCGGNDTKYTVKFVTNTTSEIDDKVVASGSKIDEPTTLSKTGYTFGGWYTNRNFTENSKVTYPYEPKANVTLYAKWTPLSYIIKVNTNGGSAIADFSKDHDSVIDSLRTELEGFTIKEWRLGNADGEVVTLPYTVTGPVTFFAVWEEHETYIKFTGTLTFSYEEPVEMPFELNLEKGDDDYSGVAWFNYSFGGNEITPEGTWEYNQNTGRIKVNAWDMMDLGGYNLEIGFNEVTAGYREGIHTLSISWMGGMMSGDITWEEPEDFWGSTPVDPDPDPVDIPTPPPFVYEHQDALHVFEGSKDVGMNVDFNLAVFADDEFVMIAKYSLGGYAITKEILGTYVLSDSTYTLTFTSGTGNIMQGELTSEQADILATLVVGTDMEEVEVVALFEGVRMLGPSEMDVSVTLYSNGIAVLETEEVELAPGMVFGGIKAATNWTHNDTTDTYTLSDFIRFNGSNGLIGHIEEMLSGASSTKDGNVYSFSEEGQGGFTITFSK